MIESHTSDPNPEQIILSVLARQEHVRLAILFGSLASGRATANSDLDLAIDIGRRLEASEKMQLIGDLAAATGRPIDLVDLQAVGESLRGINPQASFRPSGFSTA